MATIRTLPPPVGDRYNRPMPARSLRAVLLAALLLLPAVLVLGRLALFATHSADMIAFPWQIDFDEGIILHSSWLLAQGRNPYPPLGPDHFISSLYPPLFYILNAVALKLWGLNLWSGRLLSLLGTLLAAGAVVGWVWAETRSRLAGITAAALWLALGPVIVWATFYKQDILALGLGVLGGAMLAAACPPDRAKSAGAVRWGGLPRLAWWAILPLVLACWTKQSTLAPLAAAGLFLLARDWRSGLRWNVIAAATLLVPFLIANVASHGGLYTHLFLPSAEALSGERLEKNLGALWAEHWPLVIVAALVALGLLLAAARERRVPALSVCFAVISVPGVALTNLSPHANYNHLLPLLLPLCLLVGVGLGHAAARARGGLTPAWGALIGAVALLGVLPFLFAPINTWYTPLGQPLAEKADRMARLEAEIAAAPGQTVLTEDAWLALRAGKSLPYDDPAQMATQATSGRWDESQLLADIARRKFGLVVLEHDITGETYTPRWSPATLAALQANYLLRYRDVRFLEAPQPAPERPAQTRDCTLAGGPQLVGIFLPGGGPHLDAGDNQQISLYWAAGPAVSPPQPALKFSLRLADAGGGAAWQADLPPGAAAGHPWPDWPAGFAPRDDLNVQVPATAPPGAYRLILSAYVPQGAQFAPVPFVCADGGGGPGLVLAAPTVARPWGE